jgi:hypothetical protein
MRFTCHLAAISLMAAPLGGQVPALQTGDWVRLSTRALDGPPQWIVGELETITPSYVILSPLGAAPLAVPHTILTRFELRGGWHTAARGGSILGSLAGAFVAGALAAATDCEPWCLTIPLAGAGAGYALGRSSVHLRWTPIPPNRVRPHRIALQTNAVPFVLVSFPF